MRRERMKLPSILLAIAGGGLALLSWSQPWFGLVLEGAAGGGALIEVPGQVASPALAALGLAGLALAGALAIAGPGIRVVLGILAALLGGCVLLAAGLSLGDPVGSVSPAVTDATGVAGQGPTAELVAEAVATFWPVVAVIGGVLLVAAGVLVLATGAAWPRSSRRYRDAGAAFEPADSPSPASEAQSAASGGSRESGGSSPASPSDASRPARTASDRAIDDWDDLSRGDDPTD
ncbi:hypothetical protein GE115_01375 [Agromyces sp. CFH 90414]|uniref:Peptidase n=1 Tax=Agromyces agglutinans TaxID=2662258 RepID=A0A6I2F2W4_9MICO|nr:Trp biosynthesis-associated membrane protein [Agromyces agglutinans]MRG58531.1 hypothetical protein [Agromyces agglutinans]